MPAPVLFDAAPQPAENHYGGSRMFDAKQSIANTRVTNCSEGLSRNVSGSITSFQSKLD